MAAWTPPSFRYYRYPDGTMTILDENGNVVPTPPTMKHIGANGDAKVIDPWGNDVPEYVPTYPDGFFIHTFPDGSMTAVDASGVPLPIQPELGRGGPEFAAESDYAVLPDGTLYEAPVYAFPEEFFIHTFPDGSMAAVDASGVPLPIQPELGRGGPEFAAESDYAVLADGTVYEAPVYAFPEEFFIHTFSDGSMMAVDASGVPLPIQPELGHGGPEFAVASDYAVLADGTAYEAPAYSFSDEFFIHTAADGSMMAVDASGVPLPIQPVLGHGGPEFAVASDYAVLADGTVYEAPAYEFPEEFFIHTFADGSMTAVDASGVPLPIQPEMGHGGPEFAAASDYAVLPDGTMYIPPPLYPPAGEPPEEWPPADWETEGDSVPVDTGDESDGSDAVEAAADQGPDSASADPADPIGVDDGVDEELQGEIAAEDGDLTASIDDARSDIEPAAEGSLDYDVSGLLTAGLVETPIGGEAPGIPDAPALNDEVAREALGSAPSREIPAGVDEVSATPIILPSEELPVGGDVVSATPIILPSEELPVGGDVVSATPIILPSEELPVGGNDVSVLPIPVPEPPAPGGVEPNVDRTVDDEIALDRKGGDAPVGVGIDEVLPTEVEFTVEAIEEVHVEEVLFEEAEIASVESVEPAFEPEVSVLDEEGVDDLEI